MSDANKDSSKQDNRDNYTDSRNEAVKEKAKEEQRERELDDKKNKEEKANKETLEKINNNGKKEQAESAQKSSYSSKSSINTSQNRNSKVRQIYHTQENNELNIAKSQRNQQAATSYGQNVTDKQREYDEMMHKKSGNVVTNSSQSVDSGGVQRHSQNDLVKSILNAQNNTNNARKANGTSENYNPIISSNNRQPQRLSNVRANTKIRIVDNYKLKGRVGDSNAKYQERKMAAIKTVATNAIIDSRNEASSGIRKVMTAVGVMKIIPISVVKSSYKDQYKRYMQKRDDGAYLKKRNEYKRQLKDFKSGKIDRIDPRVKPTKLDKAIARGDFKQIKKYELMEINKTFAKYGVSVPLRSGQDITSICNRTIRYYNKKGREIPKDLEKALERGKQLGKADKIKGGVGRTLTNQLRQTTNMILRNGEGTRGAYIVVNATSKISRIVFKQIKNVQFAARISRNILRKNEVAAIKKYKEKIDKIQNNFTPWKTPKQKAREVKKIDSLRDKIGKKQAKINKREDKLNKKQGKKESRAKKRRDRKLKRRNALRQRIANSKIGKLASKIGSKFTFIGKFGRGIGKIGRTGASVVRFVTNPLDAIKNLVTKAISFIADKVLNIKKFLVVGAGILVGVYLILILIVYIIQLICALFDFSLTDNKTIMTHELYKLYQSDIEYISETYGESGYTLTFEDVRDEDAYQEQYESSGNEQNSDEDTLWFQSTNGAEICSMAYVNFDMDLEEYETKVIVDYVTELYYGSHEITGTDYGSSGTITLKSYYFNSLFTRGHGEGEPWTQGSAKLHSPENIQHGSYGGGLNTTQSEVYQFFHDRGYSDIAIAAILGNICGESTGGSVDIEFDYQIPQIGKGNGVGIFQFSNETKAAYFSWLTSEGKSDSIASQCEYFESTFDLCFNFRTGLGNRKDWTKYHVSTKDKYTVEDFKNWGVESNLAEDLVADYKKLGDRQLGNGQAVTDYLNSLSDEEKAVAYGTLFFTRVAEAPGTSSGDMQWISMRVKPAIELYHRMSGGFSGEVVLYMQKPYEHGSQNGLCGHAATAMALATLGCKIEGKPDCSWCESGVHLINPHDVRDTLETPLNQYGGLKFQNYLRDANVTMEDYYCKQQTADDIINALKQGKLACVCFNPYQKYTNGDNITINHHWVLLYGIDENGLIKVMSSSDERTDLRITVDTLANSHACTGIDIKGTSEDKYYHDCHNSAVRYFYRSH